MHDPAKNIRVMAAVQIEPAGASAVEAAHNLVARLIAPPIAGHQAMRVVQAHTRASLYVYREGGRISGVMGDLPLTPKGLEAVGSGRFDALGFDTDPMVLLRPEGDWDRPGILDRSAGRPATNPLGAP